MTLTTHDWAAFWTVAIALNPEGARVKVECPERIAKIRAACLIMAESNCETAVPALNDRFVRELRHLISYHALRPTPRELWPVTIIPDIGEHMNRVRDFYDSLSYS